jgi:hypothetical protein
MKPPFNFRYVEHVLGKLGVKIRAEPGEYVVMRKGGPWRERRGLDDLHDAFAYGLRLALLPAIYHPLTSGVRTFWTPHRSASMTAAPVRSGKPKPINGATNSPAPKSPPTCAAPRTSAPSLRNLGLSNYRRRPKFARRAGEGPFATIPSAEGRKARHAPASEGMGRKI